MFTDVEGSTRMWARDPVRAQSVIIEHEEMLRDLVERDHGRVVKGMGDGILAVFKSAADALLAAIDIQTLLKDHPDGLRARVAVHTGEAKITGNDYYGMALNCASRVLGTAHGGQIVLTRATVEILTRPLPHDVDLVDLGTFSLPDIDDPVQIFQATHPSLRSDFPPLRGFEAHHHNLPVRLTSFVGRKRELASASLLLEESRLLTLSGIGGGGKTRLALRLAEDHVDDYPGGVWFVALESVTDDDLVARSVARALGLPEEPGRPLLDALAARLRAVKTLLVVDNCEQVVEGSAQIIDVLLREAPDLKIIATSREALGVSGEIVYVVPPMSVPGHGECATREEALASDAVRLFLERAQRADPDFDISSDNAEAVCYLCRVVDGIPLAIELAAGKVASVSIEHLTELVADRLGVLGSTTRTIERRHRTMVAMLDWSYDLLTPEEKEMFARLATFRGSFELEDAEAVGDAEPLDTAELVVALREKSLLSVDHVSGRYRMLEPTRQYALTKLADSDVDEVARRHAEHYLDLAETASGGLHGKDQQAWLARFEAEHDNIRAAMEWALDVGDGDLALAIAAPTARLWSLHGHLEEGRSWLTRAMAAASNPPQSVLERACFMAGELAARQGEHDTARELLSRALELAESSGNDEVAAGALFNLAALRHRDGDIDEAIRLFEQTVERARRGNDEARAGHALASLALLYEDRGLVAEAERSAEEASIAGRKTGDIYLVTDALLALGEIRMNRDKTEEARSVLSEVLETASEAGIRHVESWACAYLGKAALVDGDLEEADRLLSKSLSLFQELRSPSGSEWAMRHLGRVATDNGDLERAAALLSEALSIAQTHVRPDVPLVLHAMAEAEVRRGRWEQAATLMGAAHTALDAAGVKLPPMDARSADDAMREAKERLGHPEFERLFEEGSALSPGEVSAR